MTIPTMTPAPLILAVALFSAVSGATGTSHVRDSVLTRTDSAAVGSGSTQDSAGTGSGSSTTAPPDTSSDTMQTLYYDLIGRDVQGFRAAAAVTWKVMLETEKVPHKDILERTAIRIWETGNTKWWKFTVAMHLPNARQGDGPYCVAEFTRTGLQSLKFRDALLSLDKKPEVREPQPADSTTVVDTVKTVWRFVLKVKRDKGCVATAILTTNLPDSSLISLKAFRIFYERRKDEEQRGMLFETTAPVMRGSLQQKIVVNDDKWYFECLARSSGQAGRDRFSGFKTISPVVTVEALFTPLGQPHSIVEKTGANGEKLNGKAMETVDGCNILRVQRTVEVHFEK